MQLNFSNQPNVRIEPGPALTWQGVPVTMYTGSVDALLQMIPLFRRQAFIVDGGENPNLDVLLREPIGFEQPPAIPVATVSKNYELIQHRVVIQTIMEAFASAGHNFQQTSGQLALTHFGERLLLDMELPGYEHHPIPGDLVKLKVFIINSVDRSSALNIRFAWYRLVCSNGLILPTETPTYRRVHSLLLPEKQSVEKFVRNQASRLKDQQSIFRKWAQTPVRMSQIETWVDDVVAKRWGIHAAARVCHIARTGYDGKVEPVFKKISPHEYPVSRSANVPASGAPVSDLYYLSQALSWVASREQALERRLERMSEIGDLLGPLCRSMEHDYN